jgi:predicted small lipoprotein YifL
MKQEETKMKKFFALMLALAMVFALCACGGSAEEETPAAEVAAEPAAAPEAEAEAPAEAPAAEGDLDGYKTYVLAYATAGAPTDEDAQAVADSVNACTTAEEVEAVSELTVLYENAGVLTYADWIAAGSPAADVSAMEHGDPNAGGASGEASGEPTGEPPTD